jgi:hypothetical protein
MRSPADWRAGAHGVVSGRLGGTGIPMRGEMGVDPWEASENRGHSGPGWISELHRVHRGASPSADAHVAVAVGKEAVLEDYWLSLNVLKDPPTGWLVRVRNNHTAAFRRVVVSLTAWTQCSPAIFSIRGNRRPMCCFKRISWTATASHCAAGSSNTVPIARFFASDTQPRRLRLAYGRVPDRIG